MSQELAPLIAALLEPGCYPEPAPSVELMETHASWVLLAGDFAYKIKKPITLPFLDYGTLDLRRACCEAELRLNRRFAPEMYLAVVPISGTAQNPQVGAGGTAMSAGERRTHEGAVIEYAVKMRRFDEACRLDHVCQRGELSAAHISALATAVADFHRHAARAPDAGEFGSPEQVLAAALENFSELQTLLTEPQWRQQLSELEQWTQREFVRLEAQFAARRAAGFVRECHGDLHLGNLVLQGGRVLMFDCIEFNESFRWIDVASEIAFTYVDLLDHGEPGLGGWLLSEWLSASGDYAAMPLLRFYAVYRALVRAKVAAIVVRQMGARAQEEDFAKLHGYLTLARHLSAPSPARLLITHGLAGCGKSTAAMERVLADVAGATLRLRSDVERKRLFGLTAHASSGSPPGGGMYGEAANQQTYSRLYELCALLLGSGWSVVVDAAFLRRNERTEFRGLAEQSGARFAILAPQAGVATLEQRISARRARGDDASEATHEVLHLQRQRIEPLDEAERALLMDVKSSPSTRV